MNIELPKKFSIEDKRNGQVAFVENGTLKLTRQISFRKAMTKITYQMKGRKSCYYCERKVSKEKMTIDHMFPSDFGGPTIPNNLLPACKKCNNEKGNMTRQQYEEFLKAREEGREELYLKTLQCKQEEIRKRKEYQIPEEWITQQKIQQIITNINLSEDYKRKRYRTLENYYLKYGTIQKPIVVDRKFFLLDGFLELMVAKNHNIKSIPVIVLENVEVLL